LLRSSTDVNSTQEAVTIVFARPILWLQALLVVAAVWLVGSAPAALGCPYCIQEAGFIVHEPDPYQLVVFVRDRTPRKDELAQWLAAASEVWLRESNVEAELVNLDQQPHHEARAYFDELNPQRLPAAILVSPRQQAMLVPGLSGSALSQDAVGEAVSALVMSPAREEIIAHIITDWCVVIIAEGADAAENQRLQSECAAAAQDLVGFRTEMGHTIEKPPHIISIAPDDADEAVLMWSLGLTEGNTGKAQVAVVFGMVRRVGAVLPAAEVTEMNMLDLFRLLGRNCACTSDPTWLLGPAAPVIWGQDLDLRVRDQFGFDPNSPAVLNTLAGVWVTLAEADAEPAAQALPPAQTGYMEFPVEPLPTTTAGPQSSATEPTPAQRSRRALCIAVAAVAGIVIIGTAIILLRQRRGA